MSVDNQSNKNKALTSSGAYRRLGRDEINELPLKRWKGPIQVCSDGKSLRGAIEHLQAESVLGFDTETRPAFKKGQAFPPALLQLATSNEDFLFQLAPLGIPEALREILVDPLIVKAGVSLAYDIRELNKIASVDGQGFVDLALEAKKMGVKNHGLRGLCAALLGFRISKSSQTSNWSNIDLTPAQIKYAATDAWAGRELYIRLQELKTC